MPHPTSPPQSMYHLRVGGQDGIEPSESASISSQYMEVSTCGDGTTRVSIHIYLDRMGGLIIPPKPMLIAGVLQRDREGHPRQWPASRLLGETTIVDSLQTALLPLGRNGALVPIHLGGFARVTLARTPSLPDALEKYSKRDLHHSRETVTDDFASDSSPPFIPSLAHLSHSPTSSTVLNHQPLPRSSNL